MAGRSLARTWTNGEKGAMSPPEGRGGNRRHLRTWPAGKGERRRPLQRRNACPFFISGGGKKGEEKGVHMPMFKTLRQTLTAAESLIQSSTFGREETLPFLPRGGGRVAVQSGRRKTLPWRGPKPQQQLQIFPTNEKGDSGWAVLTEREDGEGAVPGRRGSGAAVLGLLLSVSWWARGGRSHAIVASGGRKGGISTTTTRRKLRQATIRIKPTRLTAISHALLQEKEKKKKKRNPSGPGTARRRKEGRKGKTPE